MRIKSHIVCTFSEELLRELEKRNVNCKMVPNPLNDETLLVIDVIDFKDKSLLPSDAIVLESPFYSKEEINNAEWLTCRCIDPKVTLMNEERSFCLTEVYDNGMKARHKFPSGNPFYVKSAPKHRHSQGFFRSYSLSDYDLFCSERAKQVLLDYFPDLKVSFNRVLSSKNDKPVDDIYYLYIHETLAIDFIDLSKAYLFRCPVCGKETFAAPMQLAIKAEPRSAIVKTPRCFSYGGNIEYSILIVSRLFRKVLLEHKLTQGLVFEPVTLVN